MSPSDLRSLYFKECDSTNDEIKKWIQKEPDLNHGSYVTAQSQLKGRGRYGNSWLDSPESLKISYVVRAIEVPMTWVPLLTGLRLRKALLECKAELPLDLRVKWPNDIYVKREDGYFKCAGILCEAVSSLPSVVIVGIGVNCETAPTIVEKECAAVGIQRSELLAKLTTSMQEPFYTREVERILLEHDEIFLYRRGTLVQWTDSHTTDAATGSRSTGRVLGLGSAGELKVEGRFGTELLMSHEVSQVRET